LFENALKLTYGNVEFKNFPGEDPRSKGREGEGGKSGRGVGGEGEAEVGREGVEGKGSRKGKGRKEEKRRKGKGEEFTPPPPQCSRQIDATAILACYF
jgi:hypothetical protein